MKNSDFQAMNLNFYMPATTEELETKPVFPFLFTGASFATAGNSYYAITEVRAAIPQQQKDKNTRLQ